MLRILLCAFILFLATPAMAKGGGGHGGSAAGNTVRTQNQGVSQQIQNQQMYQSEQGTMGGSTGTLSNGDQTRLQDQTKDQDKTQDRDRDRLHQ